MLNPLFVIFTNLTEKFCHSWNSLDKFLNLANLPTTFGDFTILKKSFNLLLVKDQLHLVYHNRDSEKKSKNSKEFFLFNTK